jgi:tungstate transport system permease protein
MDRLWDGFVEALRLLVTGDREVWEITFRTLALSSLATACALAIGVPLGAFLALRRFFGRSVVVGLVNTGMGLPPVVVGIVVAVLLWRSGPLGELRLIYTPQAIVIAQFIIALPMIIGFTLASLQALNPKLRLQLIALGANRLQVLWLLVREARLGLLAAAMAGFGAVVSEVGAAIMVGGNLQGETRVLSTAAVLATRQGNIELAMALGFVLLFLSFAVNFLLTTVQQRSS